MPTSVGDLNYITVHGKYEDYTGNPISGSIVFVPSVVLADVASDLFLVPKQFSVALNGSGAFTINLPATDDPDISPIGWTYAVTENFVGGRTYNINVPVSAPGASISLAQLVVDNSITSPVANYVLLPYFNTQMAALQAEVSTANSLGIIVNGDGTLTFNPTGTSVVDNGNGTVSVTI